MKMWIRQQISALLEHLFVASHWVHQQIPTLREWYYNAPHIHQLLVISAALFALSLPLYLFVSMPPMGIFLFYIFFGIWTIDFLWRDRYPALKRWITDTEHAPNNDKDSYDGEELKRDTSRLHWSNMIGFVPPRHRQYCDTVCKEVPSRSIGRRVLHIFGRIFSYRIFPKWQSLHFTERLYFVAFVVICLGFLSSGVSGNISYLKGAILLGYITCSLGFVMWILPWLRKIWNFFLGKVAITFLNGLVLLADVICARLLVADALGLPPQDFDMTVAVCAWIFYIPIWLVVVATLIGLVGIIFMLHFVLLMIVDMIVQLFEVILLPVFLFLLLIILYFVHIRLIIIARFSTKDFVQRLDQPFPVGANISHLFEQQPPISLLNRSKLLKSMFKSFSHVIGIMGIIAVAVYTWQSYPAVTGSLKPAVRALAYKADFQQVSLYPGVEVSKRLRLHENGVVSYAEERDGDIVISVEKVQ